MTFPLSNQWTDLEEVNATKMNARIDAMLNLLAAAQSGFPGGLLASANSPGHTGITTATVLATVSVTLVSGKKYKVTAYFQGAQVTSTGTVTVLLGGTSGVPTNILYFQSTGPATLYGSTAAEFTAPSSGTFAFQIVGSTSAGTYTDTTATQIMVENVA